MDKSKSNTSEPGSVFGQGDLTVPTGSFASSGQARPAFSRPSESDSQMGSLSDVLPSIASLRATAGGKPYASAWVRGSCPVCGIPTTGKKTTYCRQHLPKQPESFCPTCGKKTNLRISKTAYCRAHTPLKSRPGRVNPKPPPLCVDCGTQVSSRRAQRCLKCRSLDPAFMAAITKARPSTHSEFYHCACGQRKTRYAKTCSNCRKRHLASIMRLRAPQNQIAAAQAKAQLETGFASKGEMAAAELFESLGIQVVRQAAVERYNVDFYHEATKTAIEVYGSVHRVFQSVAARDARREAWFLAHGHRFVILSTDEMHRWESILRKSFGLSG